MNTKHTPGPWEMNEGASGTLGGKMDRRIFIQTTFHDQGKITNGPEARIAHISPDAIGNSAVNIGGARFEHSISANEAEANARLIAQSPTMYDFLWMIANGGINEAGEAQIESEARAILAKINNTSADL